MKKDYRHSLDKLAGTSPKRKAALIRSLLPGIEAALQSGQSLKDIWEVLGNDGLQMSYRVFHITVSRAKKAKKPTTASNLEKQERPSKQRRAQEAKRETTDERDG